MEVLVYKGENDDYVNEDIKNFIEENIFQEHLVIMDIKIGTIDANFVNLVFICISEQQIPTSSIVQPSNIIRMSDYGK